MKKYIFLLILAGGGLLAYWYLLPVHVERHYEVQLRPLSLEITGPGLLDANNKVTVTSRIQGFLNSIDVDRNDTVTRGQVLAQLESADLQNQLVASQADALAANTAVKEAQSDRDRAAAMLNRTKIEFDRATQLVALKASPQSNLTIAEAAFRQAQADAAKVEASIDRAKAQALAADANVKVLEAKLAEATIRSPFDGVVISRERNPGDLLGPGTSLMQLVDVKSIIISARFDESARSFIKTGQTAKVRFAAEASEVLTGHVSRLNRLVDQETREFTVDITLDTLPDSWAIGQRATVAVEVHSPALVIGVPDDFIVRRNGRSGVWVERSGRAEWDPVVLGYASGSDIEITRGLKEGDIVIDAVGRFNLQPVIVAKDGK